MSSRRLSVLASLGALLLACAPEVATTAPASTPPVASTPPASDPAETCLLGQMQIDVQQRMTHDNGITVLLEDQHIGKIPLLYTAQKQALADHPNGFDPHAGGPTPQVPQPPYSNLLLARGAMVTEQFDDLEYVDNGGAKPIHTRTERVSYKYFLADAAWDCEPVAAEIKALGLPTGQADAKACVPAELRARCKQLALTPAPAANH